MIQNNWKMGHRVTSYSLEVERTCPLCGQPFKKLTPNQRICAAAKCKRAAQRAREFKRRGL
jgi:hypothetical protein